MAVQGEECCCLLCGMNEKDAPPGSARRSTCNTSVLAGACRGIRARLLLLRLASLASTPRFVTSLVSAAGLEPPLPVCPMGGNFVQSLALLLPLLPSSLLLLVLTVQPSPLLDCLRVPFL